MSREAMTDTAVRRAVAADLPAIVGLIADDSLGRTREGGPDDAAYARAFAAIERDPNNALYVIDRAGEVIGCAQLTIIPGLARRGLTRGQIEGVRVSSGHRGQGLGRWFFERLIAIARESGCGLVQLTSDAARPDAHRFYESLGFTASHVGFKLALPSA
jgi:GNAT superfamily N-acetyltransferase